MMIPKRFKMKKKCIVCGSEFNDLFLRLLGFIFRNKHEYKTCQSCRQYEAMGYSKEDIINFKGLK